MNSDESFQVWMQKLQCGDQDAAQAIWDQYFPKLVRLARRKLPAALGRVEDEQDIALSAMDSFFRAAKNDRLDQMNSADDLWRILSEITRRKTVNRVRRYLALKRGGGKVRGDSAFLFTGGRQATPSGFDDTPAREVGPEMTAILAEQIRILFENLQDSALEKLALARMEGYTSGQLAERFDCSLSTIERRLRLIREVWRQSNL